MHVWVGDKEPRDATQKQVVQLMSRTLNFIKVKQLHIQLKKNVLFNDSCNSATKTKAPAAAAEERRTSIKSSFKPARLHRSDRLSELKGMNNHIGLLARRNAN